MMGDRWIQHIPSPSVSRSFLRTNDTFSSSNPGRSGSTFVPGIAHPRIPVIGPVLFNHQPITVFDDDWVAVVSLLLFRTRGACARARLAVPGRLIGINVNRLRYVDVFAPVWSLSWPVPGSHSSNV